MNHMATVEYLGDLRTEMIHLDSGDQILTDAPKDNQGMGATFSPTDLVASALASCIITTMGITAHRNDIDMVGTSAKVTKEMGVDPRRISAIRIHLYFPKNYSENEKKRLERIAHACPVGQSLHVNLEEDITFHYPDVS